MKSHQFQLITAQLPADEKSLQAINDPELYLSQRLQSYLQSSGIKRLFPVQSAVIQHLLRDYTQFPQPWEEMFKFSGLRRHPGDLLVSAPTGSGKTLAYAIPIVEMLVGRKQCELRALIIIPTRDIIKQVKQTFDLLCRGTDLRVLALHGGNSASHGNVDSTADIMIATPGRLVDYLQQHGGEGEQQKRRRVLQHLQWLVIDEADRLLNQSYGNWLSTVLQVSMNATEIFPSPAATVATTMTKSTYNNLSSWRSLDQYDAALRNQLIEWQYQSIVDPLLLRQAASPAPSACRYQSLCGPVTHLRKLLFSATLSKNPEQMAALQLVEPVTFITASASSIVGESNINNNNNNNTNNNNDCTTSGHKYVLPASLSQYYWVCEDASQKPLQLLHLLYSQRLKHTLCFTKSIDSASRLHEICKAFVEAYPPPAGYDCHVECFTSTISPQSRAQLIQKFNRGQIQLLICTDALARGVDFRQRDSNASGARYVINYDPPAAKIYVHRCGRAARAGQPGEAHSLLAKHECRHWKQMMRKHGFMQSTVKRRIVGNKKSDELMRNDESRLGDFELMTERYASVLERLRQQKFGK